jgi:hypothetical protein
MPMPRQYRTNAERQAAYRARRSKVVPDGTPPACPGYRRWTVLLTRARQVLTSVGDEMAIYQEERSEAWQESERGAVFSELLAAVEEIIGLLEDLPLSGPQ